MQSWSEAQRHGVKHNVHKMLGKYARQTEGKGEESTCKTITKYVIHSNRMNPRQNDIYAAVSFNVITEENICSFP
jgi:hypothetical protein